MRAGNNHSQTIKPRYIATDMSEMGSSNMSIGVDMRESPLLSEDPLQRALIFLKLLAEMVSGMTDTHPGCLVAAFVYETRQFDDEIRSLMGRGILDWRQMIVNRLTDIAAKYPPKVDTSLEVLADMFTSILEGGIILAHVYNNNRALINQVLAYRTHLRLVFGDM